MVLLVSDEGDGCPNIFHAEILPLSLLCSTCFLKGKIPRLYGSTYIETWICLSFASKLIKFTHSSTLTSIGRRSYEYGKD